MVACFKSYSDIIDSDRLNSIQDQFGVLLVRAWELVMKRFVQWLFAALVLGMPAVWLDLLGTALVWGGIAWSLTTRWDWRGQKRIPVT